MSSQISIPSSVGAPLMSAHENVGSKGHVRQEAPVTPSNTPKVMAPKPVQLQINVEAERQELKEAVVLLNQQVSKNTAGLGFVMDEALGRPIVTVRNTNSGEVIRQIPNEVVVRVAHHMDTAKGLIHNSKA